MEDEKIIDLLFERDEKALSALKDKYEKYLNKTALNILGDLTESEQCVNDAYLAAWNTIPPNNPEYLTGYLAKLVRNISIDSLRRSLSQKRRAGQYALCLEELEECVPGGECPSAHYEARELSFAIERFLNGVSAEAKEIFIARYFYIKPLKEIAEDEGKSTQAVKSTLFRTRAALKTFLEKEGYDI
ncbi:MAG: RNA polymerase sigma factor [Eubacteriaceae bacterium]|nr:RNA polymerase sigma factor [Eubacteriaceae bacterium]